MKTIWIINQDATTPAIGYAGRSYYLAEELGKLGYEVYLIAGGYSHLHFKPIEMKEEYEIIDHSTFKMVWVKLPNYGGAHNKKRILNWFLFAIKLPRLIKVVKTKPDLIIYSSPPVVGFLGALAIKRKHKSKLIFELRDIWPLTLKVLGGYKWYIKEDIPANPAVPKSSS